MIARLRVFSPTAVAMNLTAQTDESAGPKFREYPLGKSARPDQRCLLELMGTALENQQFDSLVESLDPSYRRLASLVFL